MRECTAIDPKWLVEFAPSFFKVADPTKLSKRKRQERLEPLYNRFDISLFIGLIPFNYVYSYISLFKNPLFEGRSFTVGSLRRLKSKKLHTVRLQYKIKIYWHYVFQGTKNQTPGVFQGLFEDGESKLQRYLFYILGYCGMYLWITWQNFLETEHLWKIHTVRKVYAVVELLVIRLECTRNVTFLTWHRKVVSRLFTRSSCIFQCFYCILNSWVWLELRVD